MNATDPIALVRRAYALLVLGASYLQSPLLLAIRLFWGYQFFQTGWGKLFVKGPSEVAGFFASLGIPFPLLNAYLAGTTECLGGLLLLVGFASRLTAIPLIFTMLVAYVTSESEAVHAIFSDPDKFTGAAPFLFLYAAVIVLVFGPGVFSVDWLLQRKFGTRPQL